jgi:hypothetical protein
MLRYIHLGLGLFICILALALPYRVRVTYFSMVAHVVHLPFRIFGRLARYILRHLNEKQLFE